MIVLPPRVRMEPHVWILLEVIAVFANLDILVQIARQVKQIEK